MEIRWLGEPFPVVRNQDLDHTIKPRWRGERYIPKNVFFLCEEILIYDAPESATFGVA
jgi:hypothetical protein